MARVLIVGAGAAGMTAAHRLLAAGHDVEVVDKGRRPGGRLASRRVGRASFDTGAQFLTLKDAQVRRLAERWQHAGVLTTWFHGSPDLPGDGSAAGGAGPGDGHPRFRGSPRMRSLAEHLAAPLPLYLGARVTRVHRGSSAWDIEVEEPDVGPGWSLTADALLLTPPVPQTRALLDGVALDPALTARLETVRYDPCLAVLAVADQPVRLPGPGAVRLATGPVAWVADQQASGGSAVPAVVVHAAASTSRELWGAPDDEVAAALLPRVEQLAGTVLRAVHTHRWRYATPVTGDEGPPAALDTSYGAPLAVAGDGLTAGRVEGAIRSGLAAARALDAALTAQPG